MSDHRDIGSVLRSVLGLEASCQMLLALFVFGLTSCEKDPLITDLDISECDPKRRIQNTHAVEGYTDMQSYFPGETIQFKIHSLTSSIKLQIYRYGEQPVLVYQRNNVQTRVQNYYCRSYSVGCDWETSLQLTVPQVGWRSGIYAATLTNGFGASSYISFVIKSEIPSPNEILVLANTNTWQAYNDWSGQSFYEYTLNMEVENSKIVSFHRPNVTDSPIGSKGHLVNAELHLLRWMEKNNYQYDVVADYDLHLAENLLEQYKVLILNVHPEYWSLTMRLQLYNYIQGGGKLMYLGGNGVYWKVGLKYNRMEVKKNGGLHTFGGGAGGQWRNLGFPEAEILGVQYTSAGFGTYDPYKVTKSGHWIFQGTGVTNGQLFGVQSLNGGGASGHETDKMDDDSPANTVLLARGTNPNNGGASIVYYENSSGGKVFSVGSISFTGSLEVDNVIHTITKNVLDDFLQ